MNTTIRTSVIKTNSLTPESLLFIENIDVSKFDVSRFINNLSEVITHEKLVGIYKEQGLDSLKGLLETNESWQKMINISQKLPYGIKVLQPTLVEVLPLEPKQENPVKTEESFDDVSNIFTGEEGQEPIQKNEIDFFDIELGDNKNKFLPDLPGEGLIDDYIF